MFRFRLFPLIALLVLLPAAAIAETLFHPADERDTLLAEALAEALSLTAEPCEEHAAVADKAILSGGLALGTQQTLIRGLQGYSQQDFRSELLIAAPVACNDLYLVCGRQAAEEAGVLDLPSLKACLAADPYSWLIMRTFSASNADCAAAELIKTIDFDSDTFMDEAECAECLQDGPYVLVADTGAALALEREGHVVLGPLTANRTAEYPHLPCAAECGWPALPGTCYVLYASAGAELPALGQRVEQALSSEPVVSCLNALHLHPAAPDEANLDVWLSRYIAYMTAEGLFFYEM